MKKVNPVILCLILSLMLAACNQSSGNKGDAAVTKEAAELRDAFASTAFFSTKQAEAEHNKDDKTKVYYIETDEDTISAPYIGLNEDEQEFLFNYDLLSSYKPYGNYVIEEGILHAYTDDGKYQYIFEVVDENTLVFKQQGSSNVSLTDDTMGVKITDQAVFKSEN